MLAKRIDMAVMVTIMVIIVIIILITIQATIIRIIQDIIIPIDIIITTIGIRVIFRSHPLLAADGFFYQLLGTNLRMLDSLAMDVPAVCQYVL